MKKRHFDYLERMLDLILTEARKLAKKPQKDWCSKKCISCLVATARTNVDRKKHGLGFDSSEDPAMIIAKYVLLEEKKFKDWENN